jgi:hypothetical protein
VVGTIRRGKQPAVHGWIEFFPFKGALGSQRIVPIRPDGSFAATDVAVGANMITIDHVTFADQPGHRFKSRIARSIPDEVPATLNLEFQ